VSDGEFVDDVSVSGAVEPHPDSVRPATIEIAAIAVMRFTWISRPSW